MAFIERYVSKEGKIPFKCYVDDTELNEVFETKDNAKEHVNSVIEKYYDELFKEHNYLIADVYGFDGDKIVEVFAYSLSEEWPGNSISTIYVFENGEYTPEEKTTCENMDIIKGAEASYRRKTKNLEEFLNSTPYLENLEPKETNGMKVVKY